MTESSAGRSDPMSHGAQSVAVGSSETFEDFYAREFPAVVGLAYALSGSRAGSEDLAQEAFLAALRDWDRVGGFGRPDVWVRRVVANLSVSTLRRRYTEAKALGRLALRIRSTLPALSADDAEFWAAVRSLPRRQAQVIALHYLEDRPVAEIAEILGTAGGTVKKHLHEGRRALTRRLQLEEDDA
jgi:RNA polymerase sigma-70 factor, ECF subfamily